LTHPIRQAWEPTRNTRNSLSTMFSQRERPGCDSTRRPADHPWRHPLGGRDTDPDGPDSQENYIRSNITVCHPICYQILRNFLILHGLDPLCPARAPAIAMFALAITCGPTSSSGSRSSGRASLSASRRYGYCQAARSCPRRGIDAMTGQEIATMVIGVVALIGFALLAAWLIKAPK
jgi:hypothetical protein